MVNPTKWAMLEFFKEFQHGGVQSQHNALEMEGDFTKPQHL